MVVFSLAVNSKKISPSQVNNAEDKQESTSAKKRQVRTTSITSTTSSMSTRSVSRKVSSNDVNTTNNNNNNTNNSNNNNTNNNNPKKNNSPYVIKCPIELNGECSMCGIMFGNKIADVEKHLASHGVVEYEYKCGVCDKAWPSWRSSTMHFSKSVCRDVDLSKREPPKDEEVTTVNSSLYKCNLCASGGWEKKVSLSQHMRRMHPEEYNATIEVGTSKKRWTRDEINILAEIEAKMSPSDGVFINQALSEKFPSRSYEAIKSHRKREDYRELVERIRQRVQESNVDNAVLTADTSVGTANDVHNISTNNTASVNVNIDEEPTTMYNYINNEMLNANCKMSERMRNALNNFVNNNRNVCPADETLEAIYEIIENNRTKTKTKTKSTASRAIVNTNNNKNNNNTTNANKNERKSAKSKMKTDKYALYQRLYKTDRSKLASEMFDGVDNNASKPKMEDAYNHFKKIWEREGTDEEAVEEGDSVGEDILLAPITTDEIELAITNTKTNTAIGPDRVTLSDVKSLAKNELWFAFNVWLGLRQIPSKLKSNRTALLPKTNDQLDNIKNWRPITIASILIRLYNKILARRMQLVFSTSDKQTGFKALNGVGMNTMLLHNILKHARNNLNNLYIILLDVSKAFDSIPHQSITRALKRNNCPSEFIQIVNNQYQDIHTTITCGQERSPPINIKRGVKQGDPMSSILFNLVIDELFERIQDHYGYEIPGVGSVNARAFADDIALFSSTEIGMEQLLRITEEFLAERGLELNANKCVAIGIRKAGKVKKTQIIDSNVKNPPQFNVNNEIIRFLKINENCKYLGINFTPLGAVNCKEIIKKMNNSLQSLKRAPLKPQQKILMLRTHLLPRYIHSLTYTECHPKIIHIQDRHVRQWMKMTLKLPSSTSSEFFYLPTKEGGLGVSRLYDIVGRTKLRVHNTLERSNDICLRYLAGTQASAMHVRWCQSFGLNSHPHNAEIEKRKEERMNESRTKYQETVHGVGYAVFKDSPITNQWIEGQTRLLNGKAYIRAIQMRTNTIATKVSTTRGRTADKTCRRCGLADETLMHILQTCPITQGARCRRHNNIVKRVVGKLMEKGYNVHTEQGIPTPGQQTNISRPDIIATKEKCALVLDVTCVYESTKNSLKDAYRRKVDRYKMLHDSIVSRYKVEKVEFHGLCVGSRGALDNSQLTIWHRIGFTKSDLLLLALGTMEDSSKVITIFNDSNRLRL